MMISWLRRHWKKVLIHASILGSFLLYSLFLAEPLFDRVEAIPGEAKLVRTTLPQTPDGLNGGIDRLVVSASSIEIQGWAFAERLTPSEGRTYIVLSSPGRNYVFETQMLYAPMVKDDYPDSGLDLDWSGFVTTIPTRKIERADYLIGIYVTGGGIQGLKYTDGAVMVSKDTGKLVAVDASELPWLSWLPLEDDPDSIGLE